MRVLADQLADLLLCRWLSPLGMRRFFLAMRVALSFEDDLRLCPLMDMQFRLVWLLIFLLVKDLVIAKVKGIVGQRGKIFGFQF